MLNLHRGEEVLWDQTSARRRMFKEEHLFSLAKGDNLIALSSASSLAAPDRIIVDACRKVCKVKNLKIRAKIHHRNAYLLNYGVCCSNRMLILRPDHEKLS